jgi:hypothetical protein
VPDNRTISQLEAEGYDWIACVCCKGAVWAPFRIVRQKLPTVGSMTVDELGAKMRCEKCGLSAKTVLGSVLKPLAVDWAE